MKKQVYIYPNEMMLALYITVLGSMVPIIQKTFGLSGSEIGLISTLQALGLFIALILCFCVFSGLNKTLIIAYSTFGLALCMILLGINRAVFVLYILFFFIGVFNAISDSMSNAMIVDLSAKKPKFYTGLLHALWAAAGIIGPFYKKLFDDNYTNVFVSLGILTVIATSFLIFGLRKQAKMPMLQSRQRMGTIKKLIDILKIRGIPTFALLAFLNCYTQMSFVYFVAVYTGSLKNVSFTGELGLSLLFAGFLAARILYSVFGHRFSTLKIMLTMNTISFAALIAMLFCPNAVLIGVLIFVGGMGLSIAVPGLIVKACAVVPHDTTAASSIVFFGVGLGAFFGPLFTGAIGDAAGLQTGLLCAALVLVPFLTLAAFAAKRFAAKKTAS